MNIFNCIMLKKVFTEKIRKEMIKNSKKILKKKKGCWFCPDITEHEKFKNYIEQLALSAANNVKSNLKIKNSWIAYSTGEKEIDFHNHNSDYSLVYYMQTNSKNSGTMFKNGFVKSKQNDALIFDSALFHKVPNYKPKSDRRTLVLELNKI